MGTRRRRSRGGRRANLTKAARGDWAARPIAARTRRMAETSCGWQADWKRHASAGSHKRRKWRRAGDRGWTGTQVEGRGDQFVQ